MSTSKHEVLTIIGKFFKDNPEIPYKNLEDEIYQTFLKVQEESIQPYEPLKVSIIHKSINEYEAPEIHQDTKSILDEDVN